MDQDYSKFRNLTGHACATRFIALIISIDDKGEAVACADGACAACTDGKGRSGMF